MDWQSKRTYIASLIVASDPEKKTVENESRRKFTFTYYLDVEGKQLQVCRTTFLHTFNITAWQANNWKLNSIKKNQRASTIKQNKKSTKARATAEAFLKSLPTLPSHYCRSSSSKNYLYNEIPNRAALYKLFEKFCKEKDLKLPGQNV